MVKRSALLLCGLALMGQNVQAKSQYAGTFNAWAGAEVKKTHINEDGNKRFTNMSGMFDADDFMRILQIWTLDSRNKNHQKAVNAMSALVKASHVYRDFFTSNATGHCSFFVIPGTDPTKKDEPKADADDKKDKEGPASMPLVSLHQIGNIGSHLFDAFTINSDVEMVKNATNLTKLDLKLAQDKKLIMTALGILGGPLASMVAIPSMQSKSSEHKNWAVMAATAGLFFKGLQRYMIWKEQQKRLALIEEAEANNNQAVVIS